MSLRTRWGLWLCALGMSASLAEEYPWSARSNVALSLAGAEAVIERAEGAPQPAPRLIDGGRGDDSAMALGRLPADVVITLPRLTRVDAVRVFPGIVGYAGNPSGECGIRSYALDGWVNGGWVPLTEKVTRAPALLESPAGQALFCYAHRFTPRTIEKVRLRVFESSDTGRRAGQPGTAAVPANERVSNLREVEVYAADAAAAPLHSIDKLVEGDFRLPVWLNRDSASLWLYPVGTPAEALELEIAFKARETGAVPCAPLRVRLTAGDRPLKVPVPIARWPDGDYLTTVRLLRADGANSGELQRLLRVQNIPEPAKPAGPASVKGLTLPMVDTWYLESYAGELRHRIQPAELFPVTTGPLAPGRVLQGGARLSVKPDGTFEVVFWDKNRDDSDMRWHLATSRDLVRWTVAERAQTSSAAEPDGRPLRRAAQGLARAVRQAPFLAASAVARSPALPSKPVNAPAAAPEKPQERYRFYDAALDGPVDVAQIAVKWVGLKDTLLGDIPAVARSAWPIWHKSETERVVLLREPLMVDKPEYQAGELDTWRDTNDNFGGQWLSRDRKRLHYCRARTAVRFPPFRVAYDNMWQVNRILAVWSTTNGLDWRATWFSQPTEDESAGLQHYGVNTSAHEDGHLRLGYVYNYDQVSQQIWMELNTSRDGLLWKRAPGRVPIASNGPPGSWNFGMMFSDGREVAHGDHMYRTINNCFSGVHFYDFTKPPESITAASLSRRYGTRNLAEQWPFFDAVGGWEGLAKAIRGASKTTGVMRMRRDGWCSLRADGTATATTRLLEAGAELALNARTEAGGSITVELLDEAGRPLPDYSGANAARFAGDATRQALTWKGGNLKTLPKTGFRLRLTLQKADCFALYF